MATFGKRLFFGVVAFVLALLVISSLGDSDSRLQPESREPPPANPNTSRAGEHADNLRPATGGASFPYVPAEIPNFVMQRRAHAPASDLRIYGASRGWQADYFKAGSPYSYYDLQVNVWLYDSHASARNFYEAEPAKRTDHTSVRVIDGVEGTIAPAQGIEWSELSYFQLRGDTLIEIVSSVGARVDPLSLLADVEAVFGPDS